MRISLVFCFVILFLGCKTRKTEQGELGFGPELKKSFIEGPSIEDCKEELSKFENRYLSKIKDLKGYSWDKDRFTATVEISENKRLYITLTPAGSKCDSVSKTVTFVVPKDFSFEDNKIEIIEDLLWVSKLLLNEEGFAIVRQKLNESRNLNITNNKADFVYIYPNLNQETNYKKEQDLVDALNKSFMAFFYRELDSSRYQIMYIL